MKPEKLSDTIARPPLNWRHVAKAAGLTVVAAAIFFGIILGIAFILPACASAPDTEAQTTAAEIAMGVGVVAICCCAAVGLMQLKQLARKARQ